MSANVSKREEEILTRLRESIVSDNHNENGFAHQSNLKIATDLLT